MANDISIVYSLKDNFTNTLRGISTNQQKFKQDLDNTSKQLAALYDKKRQLQVDNKTADKAIKDTMKNAQSFGSNYEEVMKKNAKTKLQIQLQTEEVNNRIKETQSKMSTLNKTKANPQVNVKDNASKTIEGIKSKLSGLSKIFGIGSAIVGGAGAIGAGAAMAQTMQYGSDLEKQMVSMQHFMQVNNKNKSQTQIQSMAHDYLMNVRKNADVTPFETNDVVSAGTRALTVAGGNSKQAMDYLKLAENMAALNPQKTLDDAMEALATLKMGQTRRMQEFGFHITQADLKKAGGNLSNVKNANGISIQDMFKGGATELSTTGSGLVSTIKSKVKTQMSDAGYKMLEALKPTLTDTVTLLDKLSPKISTVGDLMVKWLTSGIQLAKELYTRYGHVGDSLEKIGAQLLPTINGAMNILIPLAVGGLDTIKNTTAFVANNFQLVKSAVEVGAVAFGTYKAAVMYTVAAQEVHNALLLVSAVRSGGLAAAQTALKAAQGSATIAQWALNAAMEANPIALTITGLVALGAGIYEVVTHWQDLCTWIEKAWDWLTKWNGAGAKQKPELTNSSGYLQTSAGTTQANSFASPSGYGMLKSRAIGIQRVPYDNYPALLHKDEQVLTKQQANSTGKGSFHIDKIADQIIIREEADIDKVATALANKLLNTSFNMS